MAKTKQFVRPPKKQKSKLTNPETADEFQEVADREEEAGGKHRVGDPAKSGRAFLRALDIYDRGLTRFPNSFDLAYNKARLQLEVTQNPALVEHVGLPLLDLLSQTLESHRYALRLNEENPDVLFNTAQVLTSLAEQLSETGRSHDSIPLLQESLELLSGCLSRQEMLLEQQEADFANAEGGVAVDEDEQPASSAASENSEQTALIEVPITASDLLDTVHASLSSLTTLVALVEESALQTYADLAHSLTEKRAVSYISLLPADLQASARFAVGLDRAIFLAAFSDAQYSYMAIELDTYLRRLEAFDLPGKDTSAHALTAEAEARTELTLSTIDRSAASAHSTAQMCWTQLTTAQKLYSTAASLPDEDAQERKPHVYQSKGDVELLRHRLASSEPPLLSESIQKSAKTLVLNAQTYYKGAAQLARASDEHDLETKAKQRWLIATDIAAILYDQQIQNQPFHGNNDVARGDLIQAIGVILDEGLIEVSLGEEIMRRIRQ